jgi:aspartate/tyrosine/aromatic aminotransferase
MERDTVVKEVVEALKIFSRDIRTQIDEMGSQLRAEIQDTANQLRAEIQETANQLRTEMQETANQLRAEMQQFRAEVNERFDRLEQKFAGLRVELTETQETVHFLASKTIQHEKKLHHLAKQLESIR